MKAKSFEMIMDRFVEKRNLACTCFEKHDSAFPKVKQILKKEYRVINCRLLFLEFHSSLEILDPGDIVEILGESHGNAIRIYRNSVKKGSSYQTSALTFQSIKKIIALSN